MVYFPHGVDDLFKINHYLLSYGTGHEAVDHNDRLADEDGDFVFVKRNGFQGFYHKKVLLSELEKCGSSIEIMEVLERAAIVRRTTKPSESENF